jgi:hypothetical protein
VFRIAQAIGDQQKAFDRMEWGWLNYVMECFNFGLKFGEWVYMLFKNGKTCIKTNGCFPLNLPINNPFVFFIIYLRAGCLFKFRKN